MTITTVSSREFNQDTSSAKKATKRGPVFITNRGRPEHVLMSIEEYERLSGNLASIVEWLAMPGSEAIKFDPPRMRDTMRRSADLG